MDLSRFWESLPAGAGETMLRIVAALGILVAGWIVALIVRAAVRRALGALKINERTRSGTGKAIDIEGLLAKAVYFLVVVMALILFFNFLRLPLAAEPLQSLVDKVLEFLPNLFAGAVLAVVAFVLATVVRKGAGAALASTNLDEKLSREAGVKPISKSLADVLYWLILLLFLPMILETLQLSGMLDPVQSMLNEGLAILPNLFAAIILGVVGWFVANILRNVVVNLLSATGADALGERAGLRGTMPLSRLIGLIVFVLVFTPVLIAALDALQIAAISAPATRMLDEMLTALPNIFSAALILGAAWLVGGFVSNVIANVLGGLGFDNLPTRLGVRALPEGTSLSKFTGRVIVFFVMLFATVEASNVLGFTSVAQLVGTMIEFGGQVLLGVAIICAGLWIANLAHGAIVRQGGDRAVFLAAVARITILGLVFAMGLNAMNVADEIVNGAFLLTVGAVAVAVALSFGLGGREAAGKQMEHWLSRMRGGPTG